MLCQHCKKNPAVVNYVEKINGNKFEYHLCAFCYADLYGELNNKANNSVWTGFFSTPVPRKKVCPVCGTSLTDFERTGLLGCASCYDVFKEELIPSILRIHGKTEHIGKVGKNMDELGLHRQLKNLQEQLENALRVKNFKEADRLNRQINAIKKTLHGGGNGQNI